MKILITGGAGFIGLHLAKALHGKGHRIDLADNFSRGQHDVELEDFLAQSSGKMISVDLLNKDAVLGLDRDYDVVFHFAAIIGVANVLKVPYRVLTENVILLNHMIQHCQQMPNLKRFFFTSTSEVYAGTLAHFDLPIPTPEATPLALTNLDHPRTSYMLSKIYGEAMVIQSGLPYTIVRPHNVYGPRMGMNHVVPELMKKTLALKSGEPLEVFSAEHRRSFCYIDDAIHQLVAMMENETCRNQTLNLGRQAPEVSMREVGETVLWVLGKTAGLCEQAAQPGSPPRRAPDMTTTDRQLGFSASVSLADGIKRTYDWYQTHYFAKAPSAPEPQP